MDLEHFPTSPAAKRMLASVSEEFYAKAYVAKWLYQVMGLEWDTVWEIIDALPEQSFVETATWGLMYHEIKWGLPVRENLDYATRRRLIYEKRDVRKPMNPWSMERLIYNLTGERAVVHDGNDDPAIPPNICDVNITCENPGIDLFAVIKTIQTVKQSHVGVAIRVAVKERRTSLRIGVRGAIISRLAPTEQSDNLRAAQTVRTGGRLAGIARQPPSEQPDNLSGRQTLRASGQFAAIARQPPSEQPDNLSGTQTLRAAGQPQAVVRLPPAQQADNLTATQSLRTGGRLAGVARQPPTEQPDKPPVPSIVRQGGRPAIVHVLRGREI